MSSLRFALMGAATVGLLFALLVYCLYAANLIAFPYDYDQGEGFELHDSVIFSQFQLPYRDTEQYPFYASNYPPLYHILAAPFVWLFGPAYWYGRLLSFAASLVSAAAIAYAVYRDGGRRRWIACLAGLAFLSSNMVYHIGPLFRQHTLMVTFETLAIVVLARAVPKASRRGIAAGLALLICAGYTKQLAAITALAAFGWIFLRMPRRSPRWLLAFGLAGGAIFLLLQVASGGFWWTQAIVANVNDYLPEQTLGLFNIWFKLHGFLILPAALLLIYELYRDRLSIYSVWFAASAILGGIAAGTWGAGDSYFTTSIAAACILSGIFLSRCASNQRTLLVGMSRTPRRLARFSVLLPLLPGLMYLAYARATLKLPTDGAFEPIAAALGVAANVRPDFFDSATYNAPGYAHIGYFLDEDDHRAGAQIVDLIRDTDAPALSEEAGFVIAAGREVIGNPTQLRNLHLAGAFTGERLIEMIDSRDFGMIILRAQFFPPPVLEAMGRAYEHQQSIRMNDFDYLILRPKEAESGR